MLSLRSLFFGLFCLPVVGMAATLGSKRTDIAHEDNGLNLGDHFASSVSIDVKVAVIGVPDDDVEGSTDVGHIEVFVQDEGGNWRDEPAVIFPPANQTGARFGAAVVVKGTTILVGAPGTANGGKVYAYDDDGVGGWDLVATLDTNETEFGDAFGAALALEGDTAAIGARFTTGGGAVYVFERVGDTWTRQQKIISTDLDTNDAFGSAVVLDGGQLFVGAPGHEADAGELTDSGAVYVFSLNLGLWEQDALVVPQEENQQSNAHFGSAIAVHDEVLLVGAPTEDEVPSNSDQGAAYVFRYDGYDWVQEQRLAVPGLLSFYPASFGTSVALQNGRVVIGAPATGTLGAGYRTDPQGSAYAFTYDAMLTEWVLEQTFQDDPLRSKAKLGSALALSGSTLLVGAPEDRQLGSARFYQMGEGWSLQDAIYRPTADGGPGKGLGSSVATSGGLTVVGQPADVTWDSELIGSVYVYDNGRAALRTKLVAPSWVAMPGEDFFDVTGNFGSVVAAEITDGQGIIAVTSTAGVFVYRVSPTDIVLEALLDVGMLPISNYGSAQLAVAISGETVLVGNSIEEWNSRELGAVHVFAKEGMSWRRQALIRGTEDAGGFGASVTVDGNTAVIGAPANAPSQAVSSAAYVYTRSGVTWTQRAKLTSPVAALDSFGQIVALKGRTLAITVPNNPHGNRILIYEGAGATWTLKQTLIGILNDTHLGTSLGFDGETIVAGLNGPGFFYGGAVTYARRDGLWKLQDSYRPVDSLDYQAFGHACAVAGPDIAIGTPLDDSAAGVDAGNLTLIHRVGALELYDGPSLAGRRVGDDGSLELKLGTQTGELVQGVSAVRYLTIYNGTTSRITGIALSADGPDSGGIFIDQLQSTALDPGQSTQFRLHVMPPDSSLDATLHLSATDQPTQDIALTGTALAVAPIFEITEQPNPDNLLQEGGSLLLKVAVSAPPGAVQYRWLKDGKDVPGASGPELLVPHVKLADAGTYEVVVLSLPGYQPGNTATLTSDPARVVVVGQPPVGDRYQLRGSKLVLRLPIAGPGYEVQWLNYLGAIVDEGPVKGSTTPQLTVSRLREEDFTSYTVVASLGSASPLWFGSVSLTEVLRQPPLFGVTDLGSFWTVGEPGVADAGTGTYPPPPGHTYTATGLPPGLRIDSRTGIISGTPTRDGEYKVRVTIVNAFGRVSQVFPLQVYPFSVNDISGTYIGMLDRDPTLNDNLGGSVKIDITRTGACTGSITFGKILTRFVCQLSGSSDQFGGRVTLRSDDKRWEYDLELKSEANGFVTGTITHDYTHYAPTQFTARRADAADQLSGYYTGLVRPVVPQATDDTYPQGVAFATVRVSNAGVVVYAGRLPDGTAVTATTVTDGSGEIPLHFLLYGGTGSFQGTVNVFRTSDYFENDYNQLGGVLSWLKKPSTSAKEVNYAAGIPLHDLQMLGFRYFTPITGEIVLALDQRWDNAFISFEQGGLCSAAMNPDLKFTLTNQNKVLLPLAPNNPTALTLKLDAATGLFTGTFTLKDTNPLSPLRTVTRKANFAGVLVPRLDAGFGSFQLPQLITGTKDKARTLSGNLVLEAFETEE